MAAVRVLPAVASTALVLTALSAPVVPAKAVGLTWIGIGGPQDWAPRPGYTLEIGNEAWRVDATHGGGVTTLSLTTPTVVRVRRLADCAPVVRFVATPGRDYYIRFASDGSARVEDWTSEGMDAGPALGDPSAPVCPSLPDTSTAEPAPAPSSGLPVLAVAAGVAAAAAVLRRPARRRSR
ncbi:MAG: hypothetical protein ACYDAN_06180 [Candidatus Limnocylindrales bacterium]